MSDTKNGRFTKARDKYADMRSSASSLLIVGILGVIYMIVDYLGILPFSLNANNNWVFTFTMAALFVTFIIAGLFTYKSASKLQKSIGTEESLTEDIKAWMSALSPAEIDQKCEDKRKAAYDAAIEDCLDNSDNSDDSDIADNSNIDDTDTPYEKTEIDGEEYDVVAFESFYDIADELKAFEREEVIIELTQAQFEDATPAHISYILEDVYDTIFTP